MRELQIRLLGPMRITASSGEDVTPAGKRAQAIIAMVALSENGERSRAWLQARLWSNRPASQGSASLRQELTKIRKIIGPAHFCTELDRVALSRVRIDALDLRRSGALASAFGSAEPPDLLEGLEIADEAFEEWLRLERANWREQIDQSALHAHTPAPAQAAIPAVPAELGLEGLPTIGVLPCVVKSSNPEISALGELTCDLISKMLLENGTLAVFDFRDLSSPHAPELAAAPQPNQGPDLLASVRLSEIAGMLEIAIGVRKVENGRLIWTQSYAAELSEWQLFTGTHVAGLVNQAIDAIEGWLLRNMPDARHSASRLVLGAAHRLFCTRPSDLETAERNLLEAYDLDPGALPLAWLAMLEAVREGERMGGDPIERRERVRDLTTRALELDRGNSLTLSLLGHANAYVLRDLEVADELTAEAIRINPYRATSWDALAMLRIYSGELEKGYQAALHGRALGRHSPYAFWYNASCGISATLLGRHEEAVRFGKLVLRQRADFRPALTHLFASQAALGDVPAARDTLDKLQAIDGQPAPDLLENTFSPTPSAVSLNRLREGLRALEAHSN